MSLRFRIQARNEVLEACGVDMDVESRQLSQLARLLQERELFARQVAELKYELRQLRVGASPPPKEESNGEAPGGQTERRGMRNPQSHYGLKEEDSQ